MWLSHPSFPQILEDAWRVVINSTKQYEFVQHLKGLKALLKRLNKEEYGHISKKALRANDEFSQFVQLFDVNSATVEDRQKLQLLRKRACTKYFHDLVKKSYRDRSIACILDEFGQPTTSLAQIGELFVAFYKDLLGKSRPRISCRAEFINDGPIVSVSQQNQLTSAVTNQEIKDALFDVDDPKAPGSDGYSTAFFKKNWDVIGEDFMDAVKEFFHSGKLLKQINYTVIALIPKTQQANVVGNFRPISCCNVIYKVISKVLATRLNTVLPSIIDHAQAAFIGGRSMSDNILLAQELIRGYARKRISPRCMLMVDLRKAYDTISWNFVEEVWNKVREKIGFPKRTLAIRSSMKWIRRLYSGNRRHSKGMAVAVACSVYHIWRHRNAVIHDESCAHLDGLVHVILTDVYRVWSLVCFGLAL
nr:hypothetical protein DM860_011126 [Ipomoea batatas]